MRNFIQLIETSLKLGSKMTTVDLDKNEVVQPDVIKLGSNPAKAKCMAALE